MVVVFENRGLLTLLEFAPSSIWHERKREGRSKVGEREEEIEHGEMY